MAIACATQNEDVQGKPIRSIYRMDIICCIKQMTSRYQLKHLDSGLHSRELNHLGIVPDHAYTDL